MEICFEARARAVCNKPSFLDETFLLIVIDENLSLQARRDLCSRETVIALFHKVLQNSERYRKAKELKRIDSE